MSSVFLSSLAFNSIIQDFWVFFPSYCVSFIDSCTTHFTEQTSMPHINRAVVCFPGIMTDSSLHSPSHNFKPPETPSALNHSVSGTEIIFKKAAFTGIPNPPEIIYLHNPLNIFHSWFSSRCLYLCVNVPFKYGSISSDLSNSTIQFGS